MAVWSMALLLTASCISLLPDFEISTGACEKVACGLGLCDVVRQVVRFPPPLTSTSSRSQISHKVVAGKVTKIKIQT